MSHASFLLHSMILALINDWDAHGRFNSIGRITNYSVCGVQYVLSPLLSWSHLTLHSSGHLINAQTPLPSITYLCVLITALELCVRVLLFSLCPTMLSVHCSSGQMENMTIVQARWCIRFSIYSQEPITTASTSSCSLPNIIFDMSMPYLIVIFIFLSLVIMLENPWIEYPFAEY